MAFNRKFINEIFTHHQPIYSKKVLKAMFERLAHASTIRVTPESLDKVKLNFSVVGTVGPCCTRSL